MQILIGLLLFSLGASAGSISFVGPCSEKPIFSKKLNSYEGNSVGHLTLNILKTYSIPFQGTEQGFNSIFNSPTGMEAMEVLSDTEMLAYGWCYSVNRKEPKSYPNEIILQKGDHIHWWFGYAHYKNAKWISQCVPAFTRKNKFCSEK